MEATITFLLISFILGAARQLPKKKIQKKIKILSKITAKMVEVTIHRFLKKGGEQFEEGVVITLFECIAFYFTETVNILRANNKPQDKK